MSAALLLDGSSALRAQLPSVANGPWTKLIHALSIDDSTGPNHGLPRRFDSVSSAGGYGAFDLRPRRLADLGMMRNVRTSNADGRVLCVGEFIRPMTAAKFLSSPLAQYNTLLESLRRYDAVRGEWSAEVTRSGALALLHRLGPHAAKKWNAHKQPSTIALFNRANGLF